jgi:hypothetical protein
LGDATLDEKLVDVSQQLTIGASDRIEITVMGRVRLGLEKGKGRQEVFRGGGNGSRQVGWDNLLKLPGSHLTSPGHNGGRATVKNQVF